MGGALSGTTALAPDSASVQAYLGLAIATALVLATEVAGRARIERKLRLARYAVDQGAEAILVSDPAGVIVLGSEAAGRLLGRSVQDLLDGRLSPSMRPSRESSRRRAGAPCARWGLPLRDRARGRGRPPPPAEVHLAFLAFDGAEFLAWSGRDLSDWRRAEEDQRLAAVERSPPGWPTRLTTRSPTSPPTWPSWRRRSPRCAGSTPT